MIRTQFFKGYENTKNVHVTVGSNRDNTPDKTELNQRETSAAPI